MLTPGGVGGAPGGPVVHVPHLTRQDSPFGAQRPHGAVARASPILALSSPEGDGGASVALKQPANLPRARSPVRFLIPKEGEKGKAGVIAFPCA